VAERKARHRNFVAAHSSRGRPYAYLVRSGQEQTALNEGCGTFRFRAARLTKRRTYFSCVFAQSRLRRFLACLVHALPPVRHVAAVAAVELPRNVVVTSWAPTPIVVLFGFHCLARLLQICLRKLSVVIIAKLATSATT
jgi:hypothetical protein